MSTNENWEFIQEDEIDITLKNLIFLFIIIIFLSCCKEEKTEKKVVKEFKDSETNNKNSKEEFDK
ncbi:hypothetical protein [Flavobacterium croceum]|nr:hypothetical protein [Flavobacterium croceum]